MDSNFVTVTGLCRAAPAEFEAQWNGRTLRILLDMSATLRLMGDCDTRDKLDVLSSKADLVAHAAQRLIDMRIEHPADHEATVTISALDLDKGASKKPARNGAVLELKIARELETDDDEKRFDERSRSW